MSYLSVSQTAEKWGISTRRIQILCGEGRIPGAMRIGAFWAIPEHAAKPPDARIKNGKYIKKIIENKNVQHLKLSIPTKLLYIGKINLSIYYQSIFFLLSLRICFWRYIF